MSCIISVQTNMENKVIFGNCIEEMKNLPNESIDLIITYQNH